MNRLSALLDLPALVTKVWRQNQSILFALGELGGRVRELKGITMALGADTLAALGEIDTATTEIADYLDSVLVAGEAIDDETAAEIRKRTAALRALKPQTTVPDESGELPDPGTGDTDVVAGTDGGASTDVGGDVDSGTSTDADGSATV